MYFTENGRVFVFGGNTWGQLGLGHRDEVSRPSCVKWLKPHRALFVACGRAHTVFVTGFKQNLYFPIDPDFLRTK